MDASDGLIGETFAIELGPEEPAALLEFGVELLDIISCQLVQLSAAQCRDDVLLNAPFLGHLGVGT